MLVDTAAEEVDEAAADALVEPSVGEAAAREVLAPALRSSMIDEMTVGATVATTSSSAVAATTLAPVAAAATAVVVVARRRAAVVSSSTTFARALSRARMPVGAG